MKTCSRCKRELPLSAFYPSKSRKDGREYTCRECDNIRGQIYRQTHSEQIKDYGRRYRETHREEIAAKQRAYWATHPERVRAISQAYYWSHTEKCRARGRAWHASHPEEGRVAAAKRRQRKRALVSSVYGLWMCSYCARQGNKTSDPDGRMWHVDHALSLACGGSHSPDNQLLTCAKCNLSKGSQPLAEWLAAQTLHIPLIEMLKARSA